MNGALWDEKRLHLGSSISVMDMRTTIRPFGRPEMALANLVTAQLARHYGASFSGHAGLSDAKLPSVEAGAQKMMSAVPTLLAGGSLWVDAGLLAIDEVCSPVQMILADEWMGALQRFTHECEVSEGSIGLETILEAGPGGHYLDKLHTVRHFREEHWNPSIWSRQMLRPWMEGGRQLDADIACERALQLRLELQRNPPQPALSDALDICEIGIPVLQVVHDLRPLGVRVVTLPVDRKVHFAVLHARTYRQSILCDRRCTHCPQEDDSEDTCRHQLQCLFRVHDILLSPLTYREVSDDCATLLRR